MLRGVGRGRAVTACAGGALPLENKDQFARSDKSHIVRHKIGRWEKQRAAPARGTPRDPVPAIL